MHNAPFFRVPHSASSHPAMLDSSGKPDPNATHLIHALLQRTVWHPEGACIPDQHGRPRPVPYNHAPAGARKLAADINLGRRTIDRLLQRLKSTGAVALHPSPLGMLVEWLTNDFSMLALTNGPQEGPHQRATSDPPANIIEPGRTRSLRTPLAAKQLRATTDAAHGRTLRPPAKPPHSGRASVTDSGHTDTPDLFTKVDCIDTINGARKEHTTCQESTESGQTGRQDESMNNNTTESQSITPGLVDQLWSSACADNPTLAPDLPPLRNVAATLEACHYQPTADSLRAFVSDLVASFDSPIHGPHKLSVDKFPERRSLRYACQLHTRPPHKPHAYWILGLEQRDRDADQAAERAADTAPHPEDDTPIADRRDHRAIELWRATLPILKRDKVGRRDLHDLLPRIAPVSLSEDAGVPTLELHLHSPEDFDRCTLRHAVIEDCARRAASCSSLQVAISLSTQSKADAAWSAICDQIRPLVPPDVAAALERTKAHDLVDLSDQGEKPFLVIHCNDARDRSQLVQWALSELCIAAGKLPDPLDFVDLQVAPEPWWSSPTRRL